MSDTLRPPPHLDQLVHVHMPVSPSLPATVVLDGRKLALSALEAEELARVVWDAAQVARRIDRALAEHLPAAPPWSRPPLGRVESDADEVP